MLVGDNLCAVPVRDNLPSVSTKFLMSRFLNKFFSSGADPQLRGTRRGRLHRRGQEVRHHFQAGRLAHDPPAQDQEADQQRRRSLVEDSAKIIGTVAVFVTFLHFGRNIKPVH